MTFAIFTRSGIVVSPGADTLIVAIGCCGMSYSIFGQFFSNRGLDIVRRAAFVFVSCTVLFHPNDNLCSDSGGIVLPAVIYGVALPPAHCTAEGRSAVSTRWIDGRFNETKE